MRQSIFVLAVLGHLWLAASAYSQASKADTRTFDVTPATPPIPALKYQLQTDPSDYRPGDGVAFYMRALLLDRTEFFDLVTKASDARDAGNDALFNSLAPKVADSAGYLVQMLQMGAERQQCNWNSGIEELGWNALLPELNQMRETATFLSVRSSYQMRQGKTDDAITTLRLGFELGRKCAQNPVLVNGLVGAGVIGLMNDRVAELINRPDSPNLYWALAALPRPILDIRQSMVGERIALPAMIPDLAKARTQELSTQQWREIVNKLIQINNDTNNAKGRTPQVPNGPSFDEQMNHGGAGTLALPAAQQHYSESRNMPAEDVAKQDAAKIVAVYYFDQYQQISDDIFKNLSAPYPQMIAGWHAVVNEIGKMKQTTPGNPFLKTVPSLQRAAISYARTDRTIAALTVVEAIRSYAAAHGDKLPDHLQDITDTPAPINPWSGKAFDYHVDKDSAVLSDVEPDDYSLHYTIQIQTPAP